MVLIICSTIIGSLTTIFTIFHFLECFTFVWLVGWSWIWLINVQHLLPLVVTSMFRSLETNTWKTKHTHIIQVSSKMVVPTFEEFWMVGWHGWHGTWRWCSQCQKLSGTFQLPVSLGVPGIPPRGLTNHKRRAGKKIAEMEQHHPLYNVVPYSYIAKLVYNFKNYGLW